MEKVCATNCIRLHDKGYKLLTSMEDQLFTKYMETTGIDPDTFYAKINDMEKSKFIESEMVAQSGNGSMEEQRKKYTSEGKTNVDSYYK